MENKTKVFFKNFIGKINTCTSKTYKTQIMKKEKKYKFKSVP